MPQGHNQECYFELIRRLHCNRPLVRRCFITDKMPDKPTCSMSRKSGLHNFHLFVFRGAGLKILLSASQNQLPK